MMPWWMSGRETVARRLWSSGARARAKTWAPSIGSPASGL